MCLVWWTNTRDMRVFKNKVSVKWGIYFLIVKDIWYTLRNQLKWTFAYDDIQCFIVHFRTGQLCPEPKLWQEDVYYQDIMDKARSIRAKGTKRNKKMDREMATQIATMHHKVRELNSSLYCQPLLTVTVNLPSYTYQISGDRYLVDMFLTDDNMAKMNQLGADVCKWSTSEMSCIRSLTVLCKIVTWMQICDLHEYVRSCVRLWPECKDVTCLVSDIDIQIIELCILL